MRVGTRLTDNIERPDGLLPRCLGHSLAFVTLHNESGEGMLELFAATQNRAPLSLLLSIRPHALLYLAERSRYILESRVSHNQQRLMANQEPRAGADLLFDGAYLLRCLRDQQTYEPVPLRYCGLSWA